MPIDVLVKRSDGVWVIPVGALQGRINRHLRRLTPSREFYYDHHTKQYYIRIQNSTEPRQGPYYYRDFAGLGRMLGIFVKNGERLPPVTVIDYRGNEYPEKPLPRELQFGALTQTLADAIQVMEAAGYTVTLNHDNKITIHQPNVTVPVIKSYGGEAPKYTEEVVNAASEFIDTSDPNPGLAGYISRDPNDDPETGEEISEEEIARLLAGPDIDTIEVTAGVPDEPNTSLAEYAQNKLRPGR